jgi:hypothetical protein
MIMATHQRIRMRAAVNTVHLKLSLIETSAKSYACEDTQAFAVAESGACSFIWLANIRKNYGCNRRLVSQGNNLGHVSTAAS